MTKRNLFELHSVFTFKHPYRTLKKSLNPKPRLLNKNLIVTLKTTLNPKPHLLNKNLTATLQTTLNPKPHLLDHIHDDLTVSLLLEDGSELLLRDRAISVLGLRV